MNPAVRGVILAVGLALPAAGVAAREIPLVAGTLLQCTVSEPDLSSRTAQVGDPVVCYAHPVQQFGCLVFPRGTELAGHFVGYKDPGRLVGKGWMEVEFDRLVIPDGEAPVSTRVIGVRGYRVDRNGHILGKGHAKRDAVEWAVPLLWPVKLATLAARGPRPELKGEKVLTLRLLDDVDVPCRGGFDPYRPGWRYFGDSGANPPTVRPFAARTEWRAFGSESGAPMAAAERAPDGGFRGRGHTVYVEPDSVKP
jgi:hypothetical protein